MNTGAEIGHTDSTAGELLLWIITASAQTHIQWVQECSNWRFASTSSIRLHGLVLRYKSNLRKVWAFCGREYSSCWHSLERV